MNQNNIKLGIQAWYHGTSEAYKFSEEFVIPIINSQLDPSDRENALIGTFFRMHLHAHALIELKMSKHFQVVMASARSIFELLLDLKILSDDLVDSGVEKYFHYHNVEKFRVADKLVRFRDENPDIELDISMYDEVVERVEERERMESHKLELWGGRKRINHWTAKTITERCELLGKNYEYLYHRLFPLMSWYTHAGPSGIVNVSSEGFKLVFAKGHEMAHSMIVEAIYIISKEFHIDKVVKDFTNSIRYLESVPGFIFLEQTKKALEL